MKFIFLSPVLMITQGQVTTPESAQWGDGADSTGKYFTDRNGNKVYESIRDAKADAYNCIEILKDAKCEEMG